MLLKTLLETTLDAGQSTEAAGFLALSREQQAADQQQVLTKDRAGDCIVVLLTMGLRQMREYRSGL